ncbi:MAG: DUF1345 domain-containing protein [Caldimonas sp.]
MTRPVPPKTDKRERTSPLVAHHRLLFCAFAGVVAGAAWPDVQTLLSRALIGWNVLAWSYLLWVAIVLTRADSGHIKRVALAQAESAATVTTFVVFAALMSMVAIVFELVAAKAAGPHHMLAHGVFAFVTVFGCWLMLPLLFALTYASAYYRRDPDKGLDFPGASEGSEPDHTDFLYFSFTIAVTAQTSDVAVTTREMRRLVLFQSVVSFVFNTTILAFSINAAASFF